MKPNMKAFTAALALSLLLPLTAVRAQAAEPVTIDTFVRAESDTAIRNLSKQIGGLGKFGHLRTPVPLDNQTIIRMNRDTLYSPAILDLSTPATVILPDPGSRYMTLHVVSQDHYMFAVSKPGRHELTKEMVGSRYASLTVRLFVDANNPEDVAAANALQDKLKIEGGGTGPLDLPDWDQEQLQTARGALNTLAKLGTDPARAFGTREEVDPLQHLMNAAAGWGGLPKKNAVYELGGVEKNDGTPYAVTVRDVPVNAFWSITVYNADGFIEVNDLGVYSFNNVTAKANDDGAIAIHFGGCKDGRVNCLPISKGWNYVVRMYEPREEILNGSWTFPVAMPARVVTAGEAQTQDGTWVLGSRTLSAPAAASDALRESIASTPQPNVSEHIRQTTFATTEEWDQLISPRDAARAQGTEALAKQWSVTITEGQIAGVAVSTVTPGEVDPAHKDRLFVHTHGGAYVLNNGLAGVYEAVIIAHGLKIPVLSIDYRMPPEHPFPAAIDDVVAVWRTLLGDRPARSMALGGTSAGGGLTLASTLRFKELGLETPGALWAGTPWTDLTKTGDSLFTNEGIDRALVTYHGLLEGAANLYADGHDLKTPLISPVYGDFAGFPPTYLVTGTRDLLLSDVVRVHRKMRVAGVVADLNVYEGVSHGDYFLVGSSESEQVLGELGEFLLRHLQ